MVPSLLDTNTVSDIIRAPAKRLASVTAHASAYFWHTAVSRSRSCPVMKCFAV